MTLIGHLHFFQGISGKPGLTGEEVFQALVKSFAFEL